MIDFRSRVKRTRADGRVVDDFEPKTGERYGLSERWRKGCRVALTRNPLENKGTAIGSLQW